MSVWTSVLGSCDRPFSVSGAAKYDHAACSLGFLYGSMVLKKSRVFRNCFWSNPQHLSRVFIMEALPCVKFVFPNIASVLAGAVNGIIVWKRVYYSVLIPR